MRRFGGSDGQSPSAIAQTTATYIHTDGLGSILDNNGGWTNGLFNLDHQTRPSMMHPMTLNVPCRSDDLLRHLRVAIVGTVTLLVMGCATTAGPVRLEDRSFADKLGLQKCQVSMPLSPSEAVEIGRKWEIYPDPEKDPDWMNMLSMQQSGDQLRLISCSEGNPYFYAVARNGEVIYRYLLPVLD